MTEAVKVCESPLLDPRQDIDILRLLHWTYATQKADVVIGQGQGLDGAEAELDGIERHGSSACGVATMLRIGELGWRISGTAPAGHLHEDAEAVHRVVMAIDDRWAAQLLIGHAKLGDAPDWMPGAKPMFDRVLNARGQQAMSYDPTDIRRHYGACRINWTLSAARILMARTQYGIWHSTVCDVAARLRQPRALLSFRLAEPLIQARPWVVAPRRRKMED